MKEPRPNPVTPIDVYMTADKAREIAANFDPNPFVRRIVFRCLTEVETSATTGHRNVEISYGFVWWGITDVTDIRKDMIEKEVIKVLREKGFDVSEVRKDGLFIVIKW